ncbi:hypothetical protein EDC01DRAFT_748853, partial [Geopyxis carbonaria]
GCVLVWGSISYDWKYLLGFLESSGKSGVCGHNYLEHVLEVFVCLIFEDLLDYPRLPNGEYFVDEAPIHYTKTENGCLVAFKRSLNIPVHSPRPASSLDLNPVENCRRIMKQRIKARRYFPGAVEEIKKTVLEEWDKLEPKDFNRYIDSMPDRINQVKQRKGLQTQY